MRRWGAKPVRHESFEYISAAEAHQGRLTSPDGRREPKALRWRQANSNRRAGSRVGPSLRQGARLVGRHFTHPSLRSKIVETKTDAKGMHRGDRQIADARKSVGRGGRVAECAGLLNRCGPKGSPGVRIPPSPFEESTRDATRVPSSFCDLAILGLLAFVLILC
jgi:hypothetical protein